MTRLTALTTVLLAVAGPASISVADPSPSLVPEAEPWASREVAQAETGVDLDLEAEPPLAADDLADLGDFVVGLHIAPIFSVFSELGAFVLPRLELGYNLPPWGRRLEVFFSLAYTAPGTDSQRPDSRLPNGGAFSYDVTQKELMLGLGLYLRIFELGTKLNPYLGLAPVIFLLETVAEGSAGGEAFGENTAQGTEIGLYGAVGLELVLGPGSGFFEIGLTWSDLDNLITGDVSTGAIAPTLGYRFMF